MEQSQVDSARLHHRQTALTAFRELSDALMVGRRFNEEQMEQPTAVSAGREAMAVAMDRYNEGNASGDEVHEAQRQILPAESTFSGIEAGRWLAVIQLYEALGSGRWLEVPRQPAGITCFTDITTGRKCGFIDAGVKSCVLVGQVERLSW